VALGGFLSHQGVINAWAVFLVTIGVNLGGTLVVYLLARRYGRRFLAGRVGRHLLTPRAIVAMEREYLRFGLAGIFLARLLPGFRSFVAPFTGLVNLSPAKAFIPIGVAASLWYGLLVYIGVQLGEEWETISRIVGHLNRSLAIFGGLLLVAFVLWAMLRRRRSQHDRLGAMFDRALAMAGSAGHDATASAAAATVLLELARDDREIPTEALQAIASRLRDQWGLAEPLEPVADHGPDAPSIRDTRELRARITGRYDLAARKDLAERLCQVVSSGGTPDQHEARLMTRAADLLGLTPDDVAAARTRVAQ
jgi:membrane protein DedA with SNARE-associated domain